MLHKNPIQWYKKTVDADLQKQSSLSNLWCLINDKKRRERKTMKLIDLSAQQYQEFLAKRHMGYTFLQSTEYITSLENRENFAILGGVENGQILYAVVVLLRPAMRIFKYASTPREWLAADSELFLNQEKLQGFISLAAKWLKAQGAIAWLVESGVEYQAHDALGAGHPDEFFNENYRTLLARLGFLKSKLWCGYDPTRQNRWACWIDLQENLAQTGKGFYLPLDNGLKRYTWKELLSLMPGTTRHSFQKASLPFLESVIVRGDEPFDLKEFDNLLQESAQKQNFEAGSSLKRENLLRNFGQKGYICMTYLNLDAYEAYLAKKRSDLEMEEKTTAAACRKMPESKKKQARLIEIQSQKKYTMQQQEELTDLRKQEAGSRIALAGGLFLETPSEMVYLYGGTRTDLTRFKGAYANQKTMLQLALDHGLQRYNLWGISGYFQPEEEGYGVYLFKKHLGAAVGEYCGEFILPLRPLLARPFLRKIRPQGFES